MSKTAFLFPGQGSQNVGMGRDLASAFPLARQTVDEANEALGFDLADLCFNGPEEQLRLTEFTQPAIFTVSVAALRVLTESGVTPDYLAGHSLGEYSANVAAGAIEFAAAARTVRRRGQLMQQAVPPGEGAMAAILGMPLEGVLNVCQESSREVGAPVEPANLNSPEQTVISGAAAAECPRSDTPAVNVLACQGSGCRQRECRDGDGPRHFAGCTHPPSHRRRSLDRIHAGAHRSGSDEFYRGRSRQSPQRTVTADRPQPEMRSSGRGTQPEKHSCRLKQSRN